MGKVYLVGAGPGDRDLITVKGVKCLQEADVIVYDRLINQELLEYARVDAQLIYCGKRPNVHTMKQGEINDLLVKHAQLGKVVARLKGGDPFIFGRGAEEAEALAKHGIPFEVIPGITSGVAALAYAGIPVTHRELGSTFALVTGHSKRGKKEELNWEHLAKGIDTVAIYMGVGNLASICQQFIHHGRPGHTPAAMVQMGTTAQQRTVTATLHTLAQEVKKAQLTTPSIVVIGEVVRMRKHIAWFEPGKSPEEQRYTPSLL